MIKLENVTKIYDNKKIIDNISFNIEENQIVGFLGVNGAGKTTTINMITGLTEPTSGKIYINGVDIVKNGKKAKKNIGFLAENVPLYIDFTTIEFLRFMAELKDVPKKEIKNEVDKVIDKLNLNEYKNKLIRNLSKGTKQRVGIAGAIIGSPKILIFDEPTVGLDPMQIIEIRNIIKDLSQKHTIFMSSHILSEISKICDRVIIIDGGKILFDGKTEELVKDDSDLENSFLNILKKENENCSQ